MSVLAWLALGLVAGALATQRPGRGGAGVAGQLTAGALGAALGGLLASVLFGWSLEAPPPAALVASAFGALAALAALGLRTADLPYE